MAYKVSVVDDSAVLRHTLIHLLESDPDLDLMGSAPNPLIAGQAIRRQRPDVLLLDIEMPGRDGRTFLRQVMAENPIPTVICSILTTDGSSMALEALAAGTVAKPSLSRKQLLEDSRRELVQTLKTAAPSRPRPRQPVARLNGSGTEAASVQGSATRLHTLAVNQPVVIGSSTGGTQALEQILTALPGDSPGIAIVQQVPGKFTTMCAQPLDGLCAVNVREAPDGDRLERGVALIAPCGRHLQLRTSSRQYFACVIDGPPVIRHEPSVDVLFRSVAEFARRDALAIILTGMGEDGVRGMKKLHDVGTHTLVQNEETCVVFGIPKEAIALGGVDEIVPLARTALIVVAFDARG